MRYQKRTHYIVAVFFVFTASLSLLFSSCFSVWQQGRETPSEQRLQIIFMLNEADYSFSQLITLEEREDSSNGIYYTGVIDDELDTLLDELVDTYNADPDTIDEVTVNDVRYYLSEGIVEAAREENYESAFKQFLRWTGYYATDLVFSVSVLEEDGTVHEVGEPVPEPPSNYDFLTRESLQLYFEYSWRLEQTP